MTEVSAIIVAAGNATRMGGPDKQFMQLGNDPVLLHSIQLFNQMSEITEIIVVTKADSVEEVQSLLAQFRFQKPNRVTAGGLTRQDSVLAGVLLCQANGLVAIHDGARPLLSAKDAGQVIADAVKHGAATLGVPVKDTIKLVYTDGFIAETPPRESLYQIQTPQVFDKQFYLTAIEHAKSKQQNYTDDCQLAEAMGVSVYVTRGSYENIKITTPEDLLLAQALWKEANA